MLTSICTFISTFSDLCVVAAIGFDSRRCELCRSESLTHFVVLPTVSSLLCQPVPRFTSLRYGNHASDLTILLSSLLLWPALISTIESDFVVLSRLSSCLRNVLVDLERCSEEWWVFVTNELSRKSKIFPVETAEKYSIYISLILSQFYYIHEYVGGMNVQKHAWSEM